VSSPPLYRFAGDTEAGQINGNVKNSFGRWWVVNPADPRSAPVKGGGDGATTSTTFPSGGVAYRAMVGATMERPA
jgi:hypothetical protein